MARSLRRTAVPAMPRLVALLLIALCAQRAKGERRLVGRRGRRRRARNVWLPLRRRTGATSRGHKQRPPAAALQAASCWLRMSTDLEGATTALGARWVACH